MLTKAKVFAIEIAKKALEIAQENAEINQTAIHFIHQDIFEIKDFEKQFDIIVSNPPYVRNKEKPEIATNVLDYEPHSALFVSDENPLVFYRKIAELALKNLNSGGFFILKLISI